MTDSMKFIPVPNKAFEQAGFTEEGVFRAEIADGKLIIEQLQTKPCILPDFIEPDCENCCFCCSCCGECMAENFISRILDTEDEEGEDDE